MRIIGEMAPGYEMILSAEAQSFLESLHDKFEGRRQNLLREREALQSRLDEGFVPGFREDAAMIREGNWLVGSTPSDLQDRRVEITGPTDRKMMINAFNSGARVFMADFEDANSPTWANMVEGQMNLIEAIDRRIEFVAENNKVYRLNEQIATLVVRPRGWHLQERHVLINGEPISASLFDFGLFVLHNARRLISRGSGPYFYLAKLEGASEAKLWDDVFTFAEEYLELEHGVIKATVLIETILGALQMEEILYELRHHVVGLNAGRWDYIFSIIKKFREHSTALLPDRARVTMTVPFMRAYATRLVSVCHRRGAHAIGGMAAFIPSRRDAQVNDEAIRQVRADKEREAQDGFDGTWVAHPDLVPVAGEVFDRFLSGRPHQKENPGTGQDVTAAQMLNFGVTGAAVTDGGIRNNIQVTLRYLESWLAGTGAVAIFNLMEDAATAEIARAQIWQWRRYGVALADGRVVTPELVQSMAHEELEKVRADLPHSGRLDKAFEIFNQVCLDDNLPDFLTTMAYSYLA